MWIVFVLITLAFLEKCTFCHVSVTQSDNTSVNGFSIMHFVQNFGYPIEFHKNLETEDGYLLDLVRLPHGRKLDNFGISKPAVLLMHGLGASCEEWVFNGPTKGLAFILADSGFDVWLGNARGTSHSRKHIRLDPDQDPQFWEFSFDEIGKFDLPVIVNYIRFTTKQERISYVGHSQGCAVFFILTATRPEFNEYFKIAVTLAPAVFQGVEGVSMNQNIGSALSFLFDSIRPALGVYELKKMPCPQSLFCNVDVLLGMLLISLAQIDPFSLSNLMRTLPDSASTRQYLHYMQLATSADFRQYDSGVTGNLKKYGNVRPPSYNLSKVSSPVAVFHGIGDVLISMHNIRRLIKILPNVVYKHFVTAEGFNHVDFLIARDIVPLVYEHVLRILLHYK